MPFWLFASLKVLQKHFLFCMQFCACHHFWSRRPYHLGLFSKNCTLPRRKACWKISRVRKGGVVNVSRDSDGTGTLNLNLHPRSRVTFINVSIVLKNCYAFSNFIILSNCSPLTTFILSFQEHPTTVFSKISVRRSKYCLEFSINWGRLKVSRWPFHSCTIFEAYLIIFLRFSEV